MKDIAREIVLNSLERLNNVPSKKCKKVCEKLFYINSKYNLGLYHAIKYHLIKDGTGSLREKIELVVNRIYGPDNSDHRLLVCDQIEEFNRTLTISDVLDDFNSGITTDVIFGTAAF